MIWIERPYLENEMIWGCIREIERQINGCLMSGQYKIILFVMVLFLSFITYKSYKMAVKKKYGKEYALYCKNTKAAGGKPVGYESFKRKRNKWEIVIPMVHAKPKKKDVVATETIQTTKIINALNAIAFMNWLAILAAIVMFCNR